MKANNFPILSAGDMSGSLTSSAVFLDNSNIIALHAVWSGTPTGDIMVQISNDDASATAVTNWINMTNSDTVTGGASGSFGWNLNGIGYRWARLVYTRVSGTGTLNIRANTRGFI